jgi:hypothetical protein
MRLPLALLALALAACGTATTVTPIPTTYSGLADTILVPTCATGACHGGANPAAGLDLTKAKGRESLLGVKVTSAEWVGTQWADFKRVDTATPENSALLVVLEQPTGLAPALQMPTGAHLTADKIAAIRAWIVAGAKND